MKGQIFFILLFVFVSVSAQKKQLNDESAKQLMKSALKMRDGLNPNRGNKELFKGKIEVINKNTIKYDNKIIFVYIDDKYRKIFENGIFFPELIIPIENKDRTILRDDSISISNFKEIGQVSKTAQKREFSFWVVYKNLLNPTEYHIILTNEKSTAETDLETFLKEAIATEIQYITLII